MGKKSENKSAEVQTRTNTDVPVSIGAIDIKYISLVLKGTSSLISHKFSEKSQTTMLAKQMKTAAAKPGREAKNPEQDYKDSLYVLKDGRYGFPLSGFKNAAVDAAAFMDGMKKTMMRGSFHLVDMDGEDLAVIQGTPQMRQDRVTVGMGTADIRFRGEFPAGWKVKLSVRYNANAISPAQIMQLFNTAGFSIGVGDWRPQKDGSHGMFEVDANGSN